jgi:integrase/recombinase XerD
MTSRVNVGLPFEEWPSEDRKLWSAAFDGTDIFADQAAAGLAPSTVYGRRAAYSLFLGFLQTVAPELLASRPAERVTIRLIEDYVGYLRQNCRDTTVVIELERLFFVIRTFFPDSDWAWLYRICRRIARDAKPIKHQEIMSPQLYSIGLSLMDSALVKAKRAGHLSKPTAIRFRDGLLIALLIEAPVRRGALSRLRIDEHVEKHAARWWVIVPGKLTKTGVPQDFQLSPRLSAYMDTYLEKIRPAFPGASSHSGLWPYLGRPMTDRMIWRRVIKRTKAKLGFAVSPHRFRTASATFLVTQDPANAHAARDLLGHKSFSMTQKHYIDRAQSRVAGRKLSNVLSKLKMGTGSSYLSA